MGEQLLYFDYSACLLQYLSSTIQQMTEAWEDILMEMDSKLLKFADDKRVNLKLDSYF